MSAPIEFFAEVPIHGVPPKTVRAFKAADLSDWMAHGADFNKPFAEVPKTARKWQVSHTGTGWALNPVILPLTFADALEVAAFLDSAVEGMSQVEYRGGDTLVGWSAMQRDSIADALRKFHATRFPILNPAGPVKP